MNRLVAVAVAAVCLSFGAAPPLAWASPPPAAETAPAPPPPDWVAGLHRQTGVIALPGAQARLSLGEDYYFLDATDSRKVLVDGWGNPPDVADDVLGMVFPARFGPMDKNTWGAVVTYHPDGYVSDKDAHKIDYDKMMEEMRTSTSAENEAREKAGFATLQLVGWADRPAYDDTRHLLIWARDIRFSDTEGDTLNYDIRLLGRKGVLSLNVVASMADLQDVRTGAASFARTAAFDNGARYADFVKGEDKVAEYGIAGLVGAGLAAAAAKKIGLLGILALALKKGAVVLVAAFGAVAAWFRRLIGKRD